MKRIAVYIIAVLSFGTFLGLAYLLSGGYGNAVTAFSYAYTFCAFIFGTVFVGGAIAKLSISEVAKTALLFGTSFAVAVAAAIIMVLWAPERASELVRIGAGDNDSAYKEYPIKGYQFIGVCVFIAYLSMGFLSWFMSLFPRPE